MPQLYKFFNPDCVDEYIVIDQDRLAEIVDSVESLSLLVMPDLTEDEKSNLRGTVEFVVNSMVVPYI